MEYTGELIVQECIHCGMAFGVAKTFDEQRRKDHASFCCPAGHKQYYLRESGEEKYRRLYQNEKQCCEYKARQLKTARASFYGLKGHVAKLKKQIQSKTGV